MVKGPGGHAFITGTAGPFINVPVAYGSVGNFGAAPPPGAGKGGDPGDDYPWKNYRQDSGADYWGEYYRECTSFVAWALHSRNGFEMPFHDNAIGWGNDAVARGFSVNNTPGLGSVAWSNRGYYGHVAWVSSLTASTVTVEEYNYSLSHPGTFDIRTVPWSAFTGYIHFKDESPGSIPAPTAHNPDGHLDGVTRISGGVHLVGWAHDADADGSALTVRALVDGQAVAQTVANVQRADVGPHGFDFTAALDNSAHTVCALAVNIGGGADTTLDGCADLPAVSASPSPSPSATSTPTASPTPSASASPTSTPAPVDRYAVTSYNRMQPNAPYHGSGFVYAYQAFTAQSNTLTYVGVTVGTPNYPDSAGQTVNIKICTTQQCTSGVLASVNATIANYGNSWADIGDLSVTPGATYYIYWTEPPPWNGQRWAIYWWSGGSTFASSDQMQAIVKGYNR